MWPDGAVEPEIEAAMQAALARIGEAGGRVVPVALPLLAEALPINAEIVLPETAARHQQYQEEWFGEHPLVYGEDVAELLQRGRRIPAIAMLRAGRLRWALRQQMEAAFASVPLLVTPSVGFGAPLVGTKQVVIGATTENILSGAIRFLAGFSLAGLPALSIRSGRPRPVCRSSCSLSRRGSGNRISWPPPPRCSGSGPRSPTSQSCRSVSLRVSLRRSNRGDGNAGLAATARDDRRHRARRMSRAAPSDRPLFIDGLQFCRWSRPVFAQLREAGLAAVHVTLAYHEGFRATVDRIIEWNWRFREHADLVLHATSAADIRRARADGRTAIIFGLQNPLPVEDDLGLVQVLHALGVRFMQLTYNNQSLLGCGWMESEDTGITRMGREVIGEMNRLGIAIDLSHAGERTALQAMELSDRPVAVTHANPATWKQTGRNVSARVLRALAEAGGMLGLSLYPHHLRDGSATTLASFCAMAAEVAETLGTTRLGIGSDLCLDQPDSVVQWMREGRWMRPAPAEARATFPPQPAWFQDSRGFANLGRGLRETGFAAADVAAVLGGNWLRFMDEAFVPAAGRGRPASVAVAGTP